MTKEGEKEGGREGGEEEQGRIPGVCEDEKGQQGGPQNERE